mmetsp:Transcript_46765/g.84440  ORF Transcript_46765/g.84440 Transcript_46765/m.84440 type:complete len:200 (-) Transcript_46765:170-769(-)
MSWRESAASVSSYQVQQKRECELFCFSSLAGPSHSQQSLHSGLDGQALNCSSLCCSHWLCCGCFEMHFKAMSEPSKAFECLPPRSGAKILWLFIQHGASWNDVVLTRCIWPLAFWCLCLPGWSLQRSSFILCVTGQWQPSFHRLQLLWNCCFCSFPLVCFWPAFSCGTWFSFASQACNAGSWHSADLQIGWKLPDVNSC